MTQALQAAQNDFKRPVSVRQTVLSGAVDGNGRANFISAGAGLTCNLSATSVALTMAFAAGFSSAGSVDYVEQLTADSASYWSSLPANNLSYLTITRTSPGVVTAGSTLAPVQYGYAYNQAAQALLHFDGTAGSTTFLDDFGNTWTAQGSAKLQTNWSKFGTAALGGAGTNNALNGTTDYIRSTAITSLGGGGWTMRGWVNPSALPGSGATTQLFCANSGGNYGCAAVEIYNNSGTIKFAYDLSSTGTSQDIAALVQGATTPATGTPYYVELTYDAVAGVYRLYVGGSQEASTTSALKVSGFTNMTVGAGSRNGGFSGAGNVNFFNGYIDEFEFLPYCDHPNGTAYSVPVAAKSVATAGYASDWFDLSSFTMKSPSAASTVAGNNPTFTTSNKQYVGEATTGATSVTSAVSYAFLGQAVVDSAVLAVNQSQVLNHSIGAPVVISTPIVNVISEYGYSPGDEVQSVPNYYDGTNNHMFVVVPDRTTIRQTTGGSAFGLINKTTGGSTVTLTMANWKFRHRVRRSF